jgi:flagellar biosynthesis protein FlhF
VAGIEEIQTFAEIAHLPLEVVYHRREVQAAVKRLRDCDVILVDCPGRTPSHTAEVPEWQEALDLLQADEVHLVLPAGLRWDIACDIRDSFNPVGVTHAILSRLDELPGDRGLAQLAERVGLPMRWVTDGHEIPAHLKEAAPRIMAALGMDESVQERRAG